MIPRVMGVLNVTPDSFSDGGRYVAVDAALERARAMVAEGAEVIDVGGESTRPGAVPVDPATEAGRVLDVVAALAPEVTVSIDTRHAEVARAAVDAGASIINDVSATLWEVAAETGAGWIAVHMAGDPATMQDDPTYGDVVVEVRDFLTDRARTATSAGVGPVWIDPGIGFGKRVEHNLALLGALDAFVDTGWPVVVGTSRKATMGVLTGRSDTARRDASGDAGAATVGTDAGPSPVDDRLEASLATATWAMQCGVEMVRAHDVRAHVHAAAVVGGEIPAPRPHASRT